MSNAPLLGFFKDMGLSVTLRDPRKTLPLDGAHGARLVLGDGWLSGIDEDIVIRSPGLRPVGEGFSLPHAYVTTEIGLFLPSSPIFTVGVTGSDGKSTTASLAAAILRESKRRVFLGGNIGTPLLPQIYDMQEGDIAVVELSSFQLYDTVASPDTGVITNLTPNHLNWHESFAEYSAAKENIFSRRRHSPFVSCFFPVPPQRAVLSASDGETPRLLSAVETPVLFSATESYAALSQRYGGVAATVVEDGHIRFYTGHGRENDTVADLSAFRLTGLHERMNLLAAVAVTYGIADKDAVARAALNAERLPHRMERIETLSGVTYYDSAIDTSPLRTATTLSALFSETKRRPIVIAGGKGKGISLAPLVDTLITYARAAVLTGDTAEEIGTRLMRAATTFPVHIAADMQEAVAIAAGLAEDGDSVILSPACTSFDRYKNYREKGEDFRRAVMLLKETKENDT